MAAQDTQRPEAATEIVLRRVIRATPLQAWHAFTDTQHVAQW